VDQLPGTSVVSTTTRGREDGVTRGRIPPHPMGPILMTPIALHKREQEREVPSNTANEELSHNTPDLYHADTQSETQNRGERNDQGTGKSRGECRCRGSALVCIDLYQFWREVGRTRPLGLIPFLLMSQRRPQMDSVLSKLS